MQENDQLNKIVEAATQLPENEREGFIKEQTKNDANLIQQVNTIIDENIQNSIDITFATIDLAPGDKVGPYHILEELGQGGMGVVFLVEQKIPVRRRLALKVVKLGMDTKDVLARFELERQVLALMSHPNVATVIDAGVTDSGRPYFVMEYVPGIPINEYADKNSLSIEKRIDLVVQACKGVFHAHQKGILHRDIKPGNVLVMEVDRMPLVKIIDFGVAKSTQQKLVNETVYTKLGVFIGTPNYTSPEQAGASPLNIDTRTDVYSLGMILYELIVGKLPFDQDTFTNKSILEIQQIIQEKQAPTPFNRLKTSRFAKKQILAKRKSSFSDLKKVLKGDINCIIMHAIEKDRIERYESVSAFEDDLVRYLKGQPVEAQLHTTLYKISRFIGRHKLMVGTLFSIVLALSVGLGSAVFALRKAEKESAHAAAVSSLIGGILLNANPWNKRYRDEITLKSVISELEKNLDNKDLLRGKEFDKARDLGLENSLIWTLREHIGDLHFSVGSYDAAEKNYRQSIALHNKEKNNEKLKLIELDLKLTKTLIAIGQIEAAEILFNESLSKLEPIENQDQAELYISAVGVYKSKGEINKNIEFERKLLKVAEKYFSKNSKQYVEQLLRLATSLSRITSKDNLQKGLDLSKEARRLTREMAPQNKELEAQSINLISNILPTITKPEQIVEETKSFVQWFHIEFGEEHISTIDMELLLSQAYLWVNNPGLTLSTIERVEPILIKQVKEGHYLIRKLNGFKSEALTMMNRYAEALILDRLQLARAVQESNAPQIAYYAAKVAKNEYFLGDLTGAKLNIEKAIKLLPSKTGWNISIYYSDLAQIHLSNGEVEKAQNLAQKSIDAESKNILAKTILGLVAFQNNNINLALNYFQDAEKDSKTYGVDNEEYKLVLSNLVLMLSITGKNKESLQLAKSIELNNSQTVTAAAIELSILVSLSSNGEKIDLEYADSLYKRVDKHWARVTVQNKTARRAAKLLGVVFAP